MRASRPRLLAAAAITGAVALSLSGCIAVPTFHLPPPVPVGSVHVLSQVSGHGDKSLGQHTAGGKITVWGRCTGKGNVTVKMTSVGSATIGCSTVANETGSTAIGITLAPNTTFQMSVHAASGTSWIVAAAATRK